jgi:hypothetical protein
LPKGTNFTSLLKISPAVRPEPLAAGFQVDGSSGAENTFIIDGQEVTNFRTGQLNGNNNLPFDLVQEVQVKSSGFEAEYGGATGGVINVVTAGGNNEFHGSFGIQFLPNSWLGDTRPFLNRWGSADGQVEYFTPPDDEGLNTFYTARLTGPIIKDKFWFSAIYSPQVFNTNRTINYYNQSNPTGRTLIETIGYKVRQRNEYALLRLDAAPSNKFRMSGTFLWNPIKVDGAVPGVGEAFTTPAQAVLPSGTLRGAAFQNTQGGRQNSNSINGAIVWTPTNKLVVNVRAGRTFLNEKLNSYGIPTQTRYLCSASGNPATIPGSGCARGFSNFPSNFQIPFDVSTRTTFDADASYYVSNFGGSHNFKFGYQYNRIANDVTDGYKNQGIVVLFYGLGIDAVLGLPATAGNLGAGYLQRFATTGAVSSANQGFYIQDSWRPTSWLSFNLGIRFEKEDVPSFQAGLPGIEFGLGDKVAPRLGVAVDLTRDGKTKLFGSYGWFYDRFKYELPRGSFGGDFFRRDYFEILPGRGALYTNYTLAAILGNNQDRAGGNCPGNNPPNPPLGTGWSVCQLDFRIPSNNPANPIDEGGAVDPNLKAARQSEFTVGMERQFGRNFLLSGRYTHKQVDRAIEDVGIPTPQGSEAYIIGNPGFGLTQTVGPSFGYPATPKAERKYDALELRFDKRLSNNYFFNVSYTYSRLFGNYSGLASSDEAGRSSPNVNRFFDLPFLGFNANGQPDNGRLATDRPHVLKFYGGYIYDWFGRKTNSTEFSIFTTAQSGTPLTTQYTLFSATAILNGRGDLGRTEGFTETDLLITHKIRIKEKYTLVLDFNVRNLFDEKNELTRQTVLSPTNFSGGSLGTGDEPATIQRVFNGGIRDLVLNYINANPTSRRFNSFNLTNGFQGPREIRFGFRFQF